MVWLARHHGDSLAHRFVGRTQDVEPIHLICLDNCYSPEDIRVVGQFVINGRPVRWRELL